MTLVDLCRTKWDRKQPTRILAAALIAVSLSSGGQPPVVPTLQARLDGLLAPLSKGAAPGCAAGIIRESRWLARGGYGHASIERGVRITPDTIFYVASVSKQFTAAALLRVVDLGKASLDDDVRKYLPELPEYSPPITIRHLVYQTSGLPDYHRLAADARRDLVENPLSRGEVLAMIAKAKPIHAAGELYRYSNSNYFLMGEIVQRASGKSLRDFARETLFEPLGMKDTQYYDDPTNDVQRRAVGYYTLGREKYGVVKPGHSLVGAGGLLTTVNDLGKWIRVFEDPNAIPASPRLGARMLERGSTSDGKATNYGAGLVHERIHDMDVVHHNGFFYGYVATFTWVPKKRMGLFALCNWSEASDTLLQGQMLREGLR
jgi:CubicO group peptidase (beta-lactamase class C family)